MGPQTPVLRAEQRHAAQYTPLLCAPQTLNTPSKCVSSLRWLEGTPMPSLSKGDTSCVQATRGLSYTRTGCQSAQPSLRVAAI